ncbi:MAG: hypothetical protein KAW12_16515 [Candidatus Aminicenantes bacterium]|nr:hypothetical protein [Candidatus Aminicenantes bacterium]
MNTTAVTIDQIKSKLSQIPIEKLPEVYDFVEFIRIRSRPKAKNIIKLEGIWKGLGFEKINDLESEIRKIRRDSEKQLIGRIDKWNT